jgi:hypothetical protein
MVRGLAAKRAGGKEKNIIKTRKVFTSNRYVNNMYEYLQSLKY